MVKLLELISEHMLKVPCSYCEVVDEAEADQVAPRLHDLAANLGLTEVEPKSYLRLVLEAAAKARKE